MDEAGTAPLRCQRCGEVSVGVGEIEVHANPREDFALFMFSCPTCGDFVVGGCRETIEALVRRGARQLELRSTSAPPLTHDDLLDFHQWLARDLPWPAVP